MDPKAAISLLARRSVEWNAARDAASADGDGRGPALGVSATLLPSSSSAGAAELLAPLRLAGGGAAAVAVRPPSPPPAAAALSPAAARTAVEITMRFQREQAARVRQFAAFETAFLAVLSTQDLLAYQTASLATTRRFQEISALINALAASLVECGATSMAALLKLVQQHEQQKLKITAHLQLQRQQIASAASPSIDDAPLRALQAELGIEMRAINEVLEEVMIELHELRERGAEDEEAEAPAAVPVEGKAP